MEPGRKIFTENAGKQCFTMVMANIIRAAILPPSRWTCNILNPNMLEGNQLYTEICMLTRMSGGTAHPIHANGYLEIDNLNVLQNTCVMYDHDVTIDYNPGWICTGFFKDNSNNGRESLTLKAAIQKLFNEENKAGILIGNDKCLGLMHYDNKSIARLKTTL